MTQHGQKTLFILVA